MIPGGMNSKEVKRMMAQMGIKSTEMPDIRTVILKGTNKDYTITNAQVTMIEAQGVKTFQILGNFKEVPKTDAEKPAVGFPEEDIRLVMEQTSSSREKAIEALKKNDGEPARAILDLMQK